MGVRPYWTGEAVSRMHIYGISASDVAIRYGCSRQYISKILAGGSASDDVVARFQSALNELIDEKMVWIEREEDKRKKCRM